MLKDKITYQQMTQKFEDAFCTHKSMCILISSTSFKINLFSENLEVYDIGDKITFQDTSGLDATLDKNLIKSVYYTDDNETDEIIINTDNSEISFLIV